MRGLLPQRYVRLTEILSRTTSDRAPSKRGMSDRLISNMRCKKDLRSDHNLSFEEALFNLDAIVALNAQCDVHV